VPVADDRLLFEMLTLEGAQAGLSWSTILKKRANYRRAFAGFDPRRVARFTVRDVTRLMGDEGIVRNRLKIESTLSNARAFLAVQAEHGSFAAWLGQQVPTPAPAEGPASMKAVPPRTEASDRLSKALKALGFRFVGSTICYAFMQAVGLVNDHLAGCCRRTAVARLQASARRFGRVPGSPPPNAKGGNRGDQLPEKVPARRAASGTRPRAAGRRPRQSGQRPAKG
jgi:DNA-3-methyladenine glycosylase I